MQLVVSTKKKEDTFSLRMLHRPEIEVAALMICFISISGWSEMQISYTRRQRGQHLGCASEKNTGCQR